jgi:hypothetical protein
MKQHKRPMRPNINSELVEKDSSQITNDQSNQPKSEQVNSSKNPFDNRYFKNENKEETQSRKGDEKTIKKETISNLSQTHSKFI